MEKNKEYKNIIYGGSFNPLHIGHLDIIDQIIHNYKFKKLIIQKVLKPYYKDETGFLIKNIPLIEDLPLEVIEDKNGYLEKFLNRHNFKSSENLYVLGADSLSNIDKWESYKKIIQSINLLVFKRHEEVINEQHLQELGFEKYSDNEYLLKQGTRLIINKFCPPNISSSQIRQGKKKALTTEVFNNYSVRFSERLKCVTKT
jgi:nicotinate-nucleotide adenylyltransferase